jgi:hypothetical protein
VEVEVDGTLIKKNVTKHRHSFVLPKYDGKRQLTFMEPANIQLIEQAWRQREEGQAYPQPLILRPEQPPGMYKAVGRKRKLSEMEEEEEDEDEDEDEEEWEDDDEEEEEEESV